MGVDRTADIRNPENNRVIGRPPPAAQPCLREPSHWAWLPTPHARSPASPKAWGWPRPNATWPRRACWRCWPGP